MLGRYPFEVATAADMLNPVLRCELLGEPPSEIFTTPERIEALTDAQVRSALTKHLTPANLTVSVVSTAADIVPTLRTALPQAQVEVVDFRAELDDSRHRR
jgi:predicted Zn-dependent peptidase